MKANLFTKMSGMLVLLACLSVCFVGCFKTDDKGDVIANGKGWLKYDGKTYDLTAAIAYGEVLHVPPFDGSDYDPSGYSMEFTNKNMSNFCGFGFYTKASTFHGAMGTYTGYSNSWPAKQGTLSNVAMGVELDGKEIGTVGDEGVSITISYSDGEYVVEGVWYDTEGNLELYYEGDVDVQ